MKVLVLLATLCVTTAPAAPVQLIVPFINGTVPGKAIHVTDENRWNLAPVDHSRRHLNITNFNTQRRKVKIPAPYPSGFKYEENIKRLLPELNWDNIKKNLEHYSSYFTRFVTSEGGYKAPIWLLQQVQDIVLKSQKQGIAVVSYPKWTYGRDSIIVTIPGRTNRTVIVGAHLDSISSSQSGRAPGADDNGSGSLLLLESLRVLLTDKDFSPGVLQNTIEFHWYAAEEVGMWGSFVIFNAYAEMKKNVWAMLNLDMVGYTKGTFDARKPEHFGMFTDYTTGELNDYLARIIEMYTDIPYVKTKCGYACSDHASAMKNGFPASYIAEAEKKYMNPYIHTDKDTMEYIDPKHVIQHGKLVIAFLYELGFSSVPEIS